MLKSFLSHSQPLCRSLPRVCCSALLQGSTCRPSSARAQEILGDFASNSTGKGGLFTPIATSEAGSSPGATQPPQQSWLTTDAFVSALRVEDSALLKQLKIDAISATADKAGRTATPFIPLDHSDFELAAVVAARALVRVAIENSSSSSSNGSDDATSSAVAVQVPFHFEMTYSASPPLLHSPHIVLAELVSVTGKSSFHVKNKITQDRDLTVRVAIRNSRTEGREATAVVVFHM